MASVKLRSAVALVATACAADVGQSGAHNSPMGGSSNAASGGSRATSGGGSATLVADASAIMSVISDDEVDELYAHACAGWKSESLDGPDAASDASTGKTVLPCSYPLSSVVGNLPRYDTGHVIYTHADTRKVNYLIAGPNSDCSSGDGWILNLTNENVVVGLTLCATTCATVQQDPSAAILILFGCGSPFPTFL